MPVHIYERTDGTSFADTRGNISTCPDTNMPVRLKMTHHDRNTITADLLNTLESRNRHVDSIRDSSMDFDAPRGNIANTYLAEANQRAREKMKIHGIGWSNNLSESGDPDSIPKDNSHLKK